MVAVGDQAPDFTLKDQNNQPVRLSDFRGARNVLLVFYPLAFTGICQGELDEIRDNLDLYENDDTVTLAISVGPSPTHKVWAFNADAGVANRGTFLIDKSGVVRFAECKQPGEVRDQSVWAAALGALA